jgi:holo-[acyl-carrier protein] synthase
MNDGMIKSIGTDLIELDRIGRVYFENGERFLRKLFTGAEREYFSRWTDPVPRIAGRFAAKEAVMKALGTGWSSGVRWRDIEVTRLPAGRPEVALHGRCLEVFESMGAERLHCTITHSRDYAMAVVVIE